MNSPCQNCPERRLVCHDRCPAYMAYHEERIVIQQKRREASEFHVYMRKTVYQLKRSKKMLK